MERLVAILGDEALKTLAKKYGKTEHEIMVAAVTGNPKILSEVKRLVVFAIENVPEVRRQLSGAGSDPLFGID